MEWLAQAWWLWQIGVWLFIVIAFWTLGSTHPDREKRRQRRSIDLPPTLALALGIALAVQQSVPLPPPPKPYEIARSWEGGTIAHEPCLDETDDGELRRCLMREDEDLYSCSVDPTKCEAR